MKNAQNPYTYSFAVEPNRKVISPNKNVFDGSEDAGSRSFCASMKFVLFLGCQFAWYFHPPACKYTMLFCVYVLGISFRIAFMPKRNENCDKLHWLDFIMLEQSLTYIQPTDRPNAATDCVLCATRPKAPLRSHTFETATFTGRNRSETETYSIYNTRIVTAVCILNLHRNIPHAYNPNPHTI